jgi:uncharacterized protein (TIGR00725 family)
MVQIPRRLQISVVGGSDADEESLAIARAVGEVIGTRDAVLICGGLGGIMEAAARGAKEKGGVTVGIIPDYHINSANPFIDIVIPSGLGHARNVVVAASGEIVIALAGSHGTRSEISVALILGKPVLGIKAWGEIPGVLQLNSVEELNKAIMLKF